MVEFLPDAIIFSSKIALIRLNNVDHHLWVLFLFVFGNAAIRQNPLPIGRESLDRMNQIRESDWQHGRDRGEHLP